MLIVFEPGLAAINNGKTYKLYSWRGRVQVVGVWTKLPVLVVKDVRIILRERDTILEQKTVGDIITKQMFLIKMPILQFCRKRVRYMPVCIVFLEKQIYIIRGIKQVMYFPFPQHFHGLTACWFFCEPRLPLTKTDQESVSSSEYLKILFPPTSVNMLTALFSGGKCSQVIFGF